jgi:hypothetical protein
MWFKDASRQKIKKMLSDNSRTHILSSLRYCDLNSSCLTEDSWVTGHNNHLPTISNDPTPKPNYVFSTRHSTSLSDLEKIILGLLDTITFFPPYNLNPWSNPYDYLALDVPQSYPTWKKNILGLHTGHNNHFPTLSPEYLIQSLRLTAYS